MNDILETYWESLRKKLPDEQIFCLLVMVIFHAYQQIKRGESSPQNLTQHTFLQAFSDIQKEDVKKAVSHLSQKVDWTLLENDRKILLIIQEVSEIVYRFLLNVPGENQAPTHKQLDILIESISESAGTAGTYIATPHSLLSFIEELFSEIAPEKTADLCCGLAILSMGICRKSVGQHAGSKLYGAEIDSTLCTIATILMELYQLSGRIAQKDILMLPEKSEDSLYDFIFLDIPRGSNQSVPYDRSDPRILNFEKKNIYPDWIFIQDALYRLNEGGYAAVLSTNGVLVRINELALRKQAIDNDWLEAVITLPANLYPNTRTGTELLIFHKGKKVSRQKKILFIDISNYYFREKRNAHTISEEGRKIACSCFKDYKEVSGISVIKQSDMLDTRTYSLKPIKYLYQEQPDTKTEGIALSKIAGITRGAQILKKDIDGTKENALFINVKDIQNSTVLYHTAELISKNNPVCKEKFRIQEDDILITSKGAAMKMAIVEAGPPLAFISGNITLIRVRKEMYDPYVLFHYLDSEQGRDSLERIQSGTTIRILNITNLSALNVPRFRLEHMKKIGALLKVKRESFLRAQKNLMENYCKEKNSLLNLLKEET